MYRQPSGFHPSGGGRRRRRDLQHRNSNFPSHNSTVPGPSTSQNQRELLEMMNRAVKKAHREIIAAGESVTAWKVSQDAMVTLKVDSWNSLGFAMQEVPNLLRLMVTEGKVNAFIHCFIATQKITSMYDLEVAICKNEGVEQFEELELGPLLRHPLVLHYFSVKSDVTEVFKITSEEIISFLCKFIRRTYKKEVRAKAIKVEEFLDFIAEKRSVAGKEKLGVRVQSLGMHISFIGKGMNLENVTLKKSVEALKSESHKKDRKDPIFSSLKKLDEDCTSEDERIDNATGCPFNLPSQDVKSSDQISSCPYPSEFEEMCGEICGYAPPPSGSPSNCTSKSFKKKGKSKNLGNSNKTKMANNMIGADLAIATNTMRVFATYWKEACCEHTVPQVFDRMVEFYNIKPKRRKKAITMFSSIPFIGLLNIAISSIKSGMWDCMSDTLQTTSKQELTQIRMKRCSEYEIIDVEPSVKDALVITEHGVEHTHNEYCLLLNLALLSHSSNPCDLPTHFDIILNVKIFLMFT